MRASPRFEADRREREELAERFFDTVRLRSCHPGSMVAINQERYGAELIAHTEGLARVAASADPGTPITSCPGWTLARLVEHVGLVHRRVAAVVERGDRVPDEEIEDASPPPGGAAEWLRAGPGLVIGAVGRAGMEAPTWSFAGRGTAGFWLRRVTHETTVHHADAALSCEREWSAAPDLAADAISEMLGFCSSPPAGAGRPDRGDLSGDGQTLHFHATDEGLGSDGEWLVERTPDGPVWSHEHRHADVAVRGPAEVLLLLLMRRIPATDPRLAVFGEAELLDHWLARTAFS
jgi:uncharacterized protein (TIGR03083 family)